MNKSYRHGQILKLINSRRIATQVDLARQLKAQGVEATQVTLSRDMRELGLIKTPEGYRQIQSGNARLSAAGPPVESIIAEFLTDARVAQNLIVLKTAPGHAMSLARAVDEERWPDIVGTVAGDDTVLVVAPDHRAAESIRRKLLALVQ